MPPQHFETEQWFANKPSTKYVCPTCEVGRLVPDVSSFSATEPSHSIAAHEHEEWDPDWITYRFSFVCVCDRSSCGEIAHVAGSGQVSDQYVEDISGSVSTEYFDSFEIHSFYPSPLLVYIPEKVPAAVAVMVQKSFALYWVDVSAAANALRASLEELMDELKIPDTIINKKGDTVRANLHQRLDFWSKTQADYADMCLALKDVGNIGSHGGNVRRQHYLDTLTILSHVLTELYENDAEKMKALAKKIRSEIKGGSFS